MAFENFPYSNFHDMNLDWILGKMKKFEDKLENITPVKSETKAFKSIADLRGSTVLEPGMYVQTYGYNALDDGGGARYLITDVEPEGYHLDLGNGLFAVLYDKEVTNKQLGMFDTVTDIHSLGLEGHDVYISGAEIITTGGEEQDLDCSLYLSDCTLTGYMFYKNMPEFMMINCTAENGVRIVTPLDLVYITGCSISGGLEITNNVKRAVITGNTIENTAVAFQCSGGVLRNAFIEGNTFHTTITTLQDGTKNECVNFHGISNSIFANNQIIHSNTSEDTHYAVDFSGDATDDHVYRAENVLITGNVIRSNKGGLTIYSVKDFVITDNIFDTERNSIGINNRNAAFTNDYGNILISGNQCNNIIEFINFGNNTSYFRYMITKNIYTGSSNFVKMSYNLPANTTVKIIGNLTKGYEFNRSTQNVSSQVEHPLIWVRVKNGDAYYRHGYVYIVSIDGGSVVDPVTGSAYSAEQYYQINGFKPTSGSYTDIKFIPVNDNYT